MSKYIIVTDTHLGYKGGSDEYHNIAISLFNRIVEVAKENGIKSLIHGGDFFDSRKAIPVRTIPIALDIISLLKTQFDMIYILAGNHDIHYKDKIDPTSLDIFMGHSDGVTIVKSPIVVGNNIHLQPWLIDGFKHMSDYSNAYLIGHFEMSGITINRAGTISKVGISTSDFKDYKMVLSGHYHTRSTTGNITYLGSPYHMTFNDEGDRGFYIFDDIDGSLELIPFTEYPKFIIFEYDKIDMSKVNGNNIKVIFTDDIGTAKINTINNKIYESCPNQLFVEFSFKESFNNDIVSDQSIDEIIDIRSIEKKYLDSSTIPEYIERSIIEGEMDKLWEKMTLK